MTKEELEKEWQQELKKLINEHDEKTKGMTEEEEFNYVKENKVNEKIVELQKKYQEKLKNLDVNSTQD